jgi:hypothetical protein
MAMSGRPAIIDPRSMDLRAFQGAVQSIRARIATLDTAVNGLQLMVGSSSLGAQVVSLQQQLISLTARLTTVENSLGVNDTTEVLVDQAVAAGMPIVPTTNGHGKLADPSDAAAVFGVIGLTTKEAAAGQSATVQRRGVLAISGAAFEVGRAVYAGPGGELVQHPSYGTVALPVGVAVSSGAVWVAPGEPVLLATGLDTEYERYMSASVELVTEALDFLAAFNALPDGLLVKTGSDLRARTLTEGTQIWIDNPDGVDGNPVISYVAAGLVRTLERAAVSDAYGATMGP